MATRSKNAKIKYAKLRLFKPSPSSPSPSGSRSQPKLENDGIHPKSPSSESIERMEQEIINLSDSEERNSTEQDEPIIKRTRLDALDQPAKPKLPKFPKKPPEGEGGVISKFFKTSEDDFEPPKPDALPKAKTKVQRKATATRKPRAPRKPKSQTDIRKVFQKYKDNDEELLKNLMLEHTLTDRLDPDQFQLALAMSRSLVDQGGSQPESNASLEDPPEEVAAKASSSSSSLSSEERRILGIRTTLEQYGFKCKNSYNDYDLNVIFGSAPKNVKKIKHNRATMLIRRDREDLVGFMERQAQRLLQEDLDRRFSDLSESDLNVRTYGSTVFWMSQNPVNSVDNLGEYYVESLVEISAVRAGYLLKDWRMIPGRERTPERRLKEESHSQEDEALLSPAKNEGEELLEDPEDSLLDMNTVPEEYRQKYNNEVPVHVRVRIAAKQEMVQEGKRSASPDLFGSDSGGEEDGRNASTKEDPVEVEETPRIESREEEEDDKFVTAQESEEVPETEEQLGGVVRATSSENIFEDSDPIFDYEVYSSEEAKMSSSAAVENECSEHVDHDNQKDVVVVLSSTDDSNSNPINAPKVNLPTDNLAFPSPGKDLSFHALAIRHRLNGVPETEVETIELEDDGSEDENDGISVELGRKSLRSDEFEADSDNRQAKKRSSVTAIDSGISEKDQFFDKTIFPSAAKELSFRALSAVNQLNGTTNVDLEAKQLREDNCKIKKTERIVTGNDSFKSAEQSPISEQLVNYSESPSGDDSVQECAHEVEQNNDDVIISSSESMIACNAKQTRNSDDISKDTACESDIEKDEENCSTERISESFDSPTGDDEPEDVLIISDDEVNYSIRQDFSPFYNVSPLSPSGANPDVSRNIVQPISRANDCEDLDGTKVYFDVEDYKRLSSDMNNSAEHQKEDKDAVESTVAPDESNRADNTMAFLDGLIKKFNLPTTLTKQSTCDEPKPPDLEDYMNNYEIPNFPDDPDNNSTDVVDDVQEVPMESSAPIPSEQLDLEIEQILSQARITCTQLEQQQRPRGSPIRRATSDSVLAGPSKLNPNIIKSPIVKRKGGFDDKFEDLTRDRAPPPIDIEIRLDCVSPRPDYERMESPELHRELFKYGMKQLKRRKAVQFLNYIYDQTHPFVEVVDVDECDCDEEDYGDGNDVADVMPRRGDNSVPEMENEEYILPSKPRKKTFWCAVPLHIAFHNMIDENPALRRQMLRYQPIDLDAIYSHLKEIDLRYESNDLISFLDKRCITFRTAQGSGSRTKKTPATQAAR